ncbi:uncharacterized protein [Nicotiana tomentosiformis]|uniref:uncharacterized protein n=1 Tax=Nicotiana tomentosiformis TaxID=4098 RepID=UPI00388C68C2
MDPLKYISQKPMPTGRLAKWQILLTEFDIIYVTRTVMKAQALADHLAENPVDEEYEPLKTYFPDEEVMYIHEVDLDYKLEVRHIPRIHNEIADTLATLASMLHHPDKTYVDPLHIQVRDQHAYCNVVEEELDGEPWFHDIKEYIKSRVYPVHGDLIHSLPSELHTMSAPWPFVAWGIDVIGPIDPTASNGHRFILVAIDYFTKWVEAVTFKYVTKKAVVCQQFKIMYRNSTLYRPKANGAVEAANKNIKKILRKMAQGSRQWHEKLHFALLGYRTAIRTSVGATPYLLVYGTEAVIPAEVEISSLRIVTEAEIDDDECVKTRLEQMSLIDEKRLAAAEAKGKFSPNWQGPFIVTRVLPNGALYLTDIEGKCVDMSINSDAVKRGRKFGHSRGSSMRKVWFRGKEFCSVCRDPLGREHGSSKFIFSSQDPPG